MTLPINAASKFSKLTKKQQKTSVLQASPTYQVWQLNQRWQKELRIALAQLDLTYTEFVVLTVLVYDLQWQTWSQTHLAQWAQLDKMVVSQTLASLQRKQLVLRRTNVIDQRRQTLRVAGKGRLRLAQAVKTVQAVDQRLAAEPNPMANLKITKTKIDWATRATKAQPKSARSIPRQLDRPKLRRG